MNKKTFISILVLGLVIIFLSTGRGYAQVEKDDLRIPDPSHVQILTMRDGSTLIGRIVEIEKGEIQFETELGKMTVPLVKIKEIKEIPASLIKDGKYWFPNPNATRLYIGSTGRNLKKGRGYFADCYLFFPMVAYGITDNITIGGGVSLFPWIGIDNQLLYFIPKLGLISKDNFALSAGALVIKLPDFGDEELPFVGILSGVGTFGSLDRSITIGLGYGFVDTDFADKPMVILGFEQRLSRRTAFVTENWILPGVDQPLISYGVRLFGEAISVDLAFISVLGEDIFFPGIPYIDFVFNF